MITSTIKKRSLLLLLLLTSCIPPIIYPTPVPTISPTIHPTTSPTVSVIATPTLFSVADYLGNFFVINDECPHLCWLGISPGVTTAEEARSLLKASTHIKQGNFNMSAIPDVETYYWWDDFGVFVHFEKDLVKSISLERLEHAGYDLADFIQFLGEPDEIRIGVYKTLECDGVAYLLYYSSRKTVLEISHGVSDGPQPDDWIYAMTLNTEFDDSFFKDRLVPKVYDSDLSNPQSWLGYEKLQEYLPGQNLPMSPCRQSEPTP